nr:hypothetical protein [Tanacetum cinerariifolium]
FVGKDGKEIFGMPIPDALLTDEIKGAPYYGEYQEHVAKYQQYLDTEQGKAEERGATESLKATKGTKPKVAKATRPTGDKASMLTSTQPPKYKPAPTHPSKAVPENKRKLVKETLDEPSLEKRSKGGLVGKIRKPRSPLKLVDEPSAKDVPVEEPAYNKEEEREKRRRTPMLNEATGHAESPSLDAELALTNSEIKSNNIASKIDTGYQDEGQVGPNPSDHDEGQAGPNTGVQDEGQAGSNPSDAAESQPQSSHMVHVVPNLEHVDLESTDALTQQNPEQMDDEFTITAYQNVQENLKMPSENPMIPEEPASSTGTLSSLQNLEKELSFTYQFFVEKQSEKD